MNISKWQIFCLLATIFPEAVIEYLVTPLLPFMVRSFAASNSAAGAGAAASDKNVGYLTGLLGSSFYAPLLVTNAMWGGLSDHIGRKPVLVLGLIFGGLSTFVLGLSRTFWLAFLCRFVAGIFGANSTVVKGRLGECSDEVQRAWGYSMYGALFGLGGLLGPILGGQLVGKTASSDSSSSPPHPSSPDPPSPSTSFFLDEYPFILVCSVGAILSIISLIITLFFLKEGRQSNQPPLKKISNLSELFGILRLIFFPGSKSSFSSSPSLNDGSAAYTRILQASDEDLALHPISNNGSSASSNSNPNSSGTLVKNCTSSISREVIFQLDSEEDSDGGGGAVGDHVDDGELGPRSTGRSSTRIISAPRNRSRSPLKDDQNQQLQQQQESVMLGIDVDDKNDDDNNDQHNTIPPTNSLLLPSAILPISLYCCIACVCMIYSTAIPLYFSSSLESGGLALTASQSSIPITTIALSALLLQMSPFYKIVAKYGSSRCYSVAMSLLCPCLVLIPAVGSLTSSSSPPTPTATFSSWFQIASLCAVMIPVGFGEAVSYQSVILMITESVPVSKLGITHGFACTAAAVVRTLSPTITGILWEMGVKMGWSSFAFFVACLLACLGVFGSSYASPMKRHLDGDPLIGESR